MNKADYWHECLAQSLEEHGVIASEQQIIAIASDIEGAHENIGMAFYLPENPMAGEIAGLQKALKKEKEKVGCRRCNGNGYITSNFGDRSSTSQCDKCHGEGKHAP